MTFDWKYITSLPPKNQLVWVHTGRGYVFDLAVWNGEKWLPWVYFNSQDWRTLPDVQVVAWSPIHWGEVDDSLPEIMRVGD